ncbi:hypothetical protein PCC7418_2771 [Halothece sp. PCC 7418]|uniref:hypothetical protein n=1 Tax=Halothece sp. (strain PCC 7418) TaxID=65093 RepID=UPI0002A06D04|nr:hypothetical protein [Halothece sp. PCC 7418]AFZ44907.1 hypothetical protein PCC7418_2771 [Halothece sp. PCC 7418]
MKLAHIINPVNFTKGSEHERAQLITLESLYRAQDYASKRGVEVRLLSAQFPEDRKVVPDWMEATRDLKTSSLDYPEFLDKRKLPLISDIIERGIESIKDEEALIYSNIDIALQPYFYVRVAEKLKEGNNALSITRRTIPENLTSLEEMYAQVGSKHPGDDCFVFAYNSFDKLNLKPVFVGAAWFDRILLLNCAAFCHPFEKIRDEQLTFHLGDDRSWFNEKTRTVASSNKDYLIELISEIEAEQGYCPNNSTLWPHVMSIYDKLGFVVERNHQSFFTRVNQKIKRTFSRSK